MMYNRKWLSEVFYIFRNSRLKVLRKKAVLKNISNSQVSLDMRVFTCDFCGNFVDHLICWKGVSDCPANIYLLKINNRDT